MPGPKGVGLTKWFDQKWVNIGAPKKKGKYQPCGTSGKGGSGYAKCVPAAKAARMSAKQKKSAVRRKRAHKMMCLTASCPVSATSPFQKLLHR